MRLFSFISFFSYFVNNEALQCALCSFMDERNEFNEKSPCNELRVISSNSFFSLFVSLQGRAGSIVQNHVLRGQFLPVLALHSPALFPRASIPVVPTGYSGSWRVTAVPSTPERAKP